MAEQDARLERLLSGVLKLPLPTPFKVGDVNSYVFAGEHGFDIVDPGPSSPRNLIILEKALARCGLGISRLNRVFLTHGHEDHGGLSLEIAGLSDARISVGAEDQAMLGMNVRDVFRANSERILDRYRKLGLPENELKVLPAFFEERDHQGAIPERTDALRDGESMRAGEIILKVIMAPGHTKGSACYYVEEDRVLFSGDTLIGHITPNPGAAIYNDILFNDEIEYDPLKTFLITLRRLQTLNARVAYPGHGKPILKPNELIKRYFDHHNKRLGQVLASLDSGPLTCRGVTQALFGNCNKIDEIILQVIEAYAHLIYLVEEGRVVTSAWDDGCRTYRQS